MAAQPEASTVVRATVEASTVVVAALLEVATEVVAAATVADSTRSIQLKVGRRYRWPSFAVPAEAEVDAILYRLPSSNATQYRLAIRG